MDVFSDKAIKAASVDGISLLAKGPGIYAILNRASRMLKIGESVNIYKRCREEFCKIRAGNADNIRIRRDAQIHGADSFFCYTLECLNPTGRIRLKIKLKARELWWVQQLHVHDERYGYNLDAGGRRTPATRFRDSERKLMRSNSRKYVLLPWTDFHAPINTDLLHSWLPGS